MTVACKFAVQAVTFNKKDCQNLKKKSRKKYNTSSGMILVGLSDEVYLD